jgi:hypothetical protein
MGQYRTKLLALGGAAALVVVAAALAFAAGSRAASGNICSKPSTGNPLTGATCVTQLVEPHFVSSGNDALSVTKFLNQAGGGGATATHVVVAVNFPSPVTVKSIGLTVNGSPADMTGCTPILGPSGTMASSVSCPAGNIVGGGSAKLTVRFTTTTTMTLTGSAAYGEGPGNPSNPPNDFQVNYDTVNVLTDGSIVGAGCFDPGSIPQTITGAGTLQQTQLSGVGPNNSSLPCTFVDAGVKPGLSTMPGVTQVSFVEFPSFGSGFATVYMILTPIPTGFNLNKSPIFEDTSGTGSFSSFVSVPACDKNGFIVGPVGIPPVGNDSCVFARTSLGHGNGEIGIHVFLANPFDQTYKG